MFYIYKITINTNGKIYIGQTNNPKRRWGRHKVQAKSKNPEIRVDCAIKKYGIDNCNFDIIAACKTQEDVDFVEELCIKQYNSNINNGRGYNIADGGARQYKNTNGTFKKQSEPWNKGKKGVMPAPWNKGKKGLPSPRKGISKYDWPSDEELGQMACNHSLSQIGKNLGIPVVLVSKRFKDRNIKYDPYIKVGNIITKVYTPLGEDASRSKLTSEQVLEIIKLSEIETQINIAKQFNVTDGCIHSILVGKNWSHLTGIKSPNSKAS